MVVVGKFSWTFNDKGEGVSTGVEGDAASARVFLLWGVLVLIWGELVLIRGRLGRLGLGGFGSGVLGVSLGSAFVLEISLNLNR